LYSGIGSIVPLSSQLTWKHSEYPGQSKSVSQKLLHPANTQEAPGTHSPVFEQTSDTGVFDVAKHAVDPSVFATSQL